MSSLKKAALFGVSLLWLVRPLPAGDAFSVPAYPGTAAFGGVIQQTMVALPRRHAARRGNGSTVLKGRAACGKRGSRDFSAAQGRFTSPDWPEAPALNLVIGA